MGVFDDKKFEGLDWISQATEPIDSQMNEVLGLIPELIQIDFKTYRDIIGDSHYGLDLSVRKFVSYAVSKYASNLSFSYHQMNALDKCFQLEFNGDMVVLDFEKEEITGGEIHLVKLNSIMDEKVLANMLGEEGINVLSYSRFHGNTSRINEVMELLGKCEQGLRTRSERKKRYVLVNRLKTLFKNNEWNIKDTELANKVGRWISEYISDGNLSAFSNFCRLKVMTHKGQPIYSMEEVE